MLTLKAPVKFQKDQTKTVGGVKGIRYPLKIRNQAPRTMESRKQCPSAFLRKKAGDNNTKQYVECSLCAASDLGLQHLLRPVCLMMTLIWCFRSLSTLFML